MLLKSTEVIAVLRGAGIESRKFSFSDEASHTITATDVYRVRNTLYTSLPPELQDKKTSLGGRVENVPLYIAEVYDCDNHAFEMMTFAARVNAVTAVKKPKRAKGGILLGTISYHSMGNGRFGPHATNIFINHQRQVKFFEPGDGRIINLSDSEKETIWHGRFV